MMALRVRRLAALSAATAAFVLLLLSASAQPQTPAPSGPVVYSAVVDGIIHPVSAEYMISTMNQADEAQAALVVFTLRTPGGLVDSTRDIVTRMLAAETPVAVLVAPSGARAASAGFILTIAADVAAMAPGTHIGAAHPVSAGGEATDETMAKKAAADVAAYVRTLATARQRNVPLSEEAVNESRAFTEREAVNASPPLIDLIANDVPELLRAISSRGIRRFDGSMQQVDLTNATIVAFDMTVRQHILSAIANPNVAYLLLSIGMLALTIELWNPGAILPGVVGGVSLLLAFFALRVLPVNYVGVLLIVLGTVMLILEMAVTSFGLLAIGGVVSLLLGSMILMDAPIPELELSFQLVVPIVAALVGITMLLVRLGVRAQRQPPATGILAMIGQTGQALTEIGPGSIGTVSTRGEIWQATADEPIAAGTAVRIMGTNGLTLTVQKQ